MRLRPFDLIQPECVAEAVDALGRAGSEARLIAGGTALVPKVSAMISLLASPERRS
jgi:CO/xanthine dehydrogenase FAD-binding subunit